MCVFKCHQEKEKDSKSGHAAYQIRKRKRVWTAVHKGSGLAVEEQTASGKTFSVTCNLPQAI